VSERESSQGGTLSRPDHAQALDRGHRLGRDAEAVPAYRTALALSDNTAEQEFLAERIRSARPQG
jgi:predicted RNA polymerase sigma factor